MRNIAKCFIILSFLSFLFSGCKIHGGGKSEITLLLNKNVRSIVPEATTAHFTGGYEMVNNVIPASNTTGLSTGHGESIASAQFNSEAWWTNAANWHIDATAVPPAAAWDFVNVWEWDGDAGLPRLQK